MARNILAVSTGYATYVLLTIVIFQIKQIDLEVQPRWNEAIMLIVMLGVAAIISGYVTLLISMTHQKATLLALCGVMVVISIISMLSQPETSKWTQLISIFLLSPLCYLGGYIKLLKS